jgi:hypothetical protein
LATASAFALARGMLDGLFDDCGSPIGIEIARRDAQDFV